MNADLAESNLSRHWEVIFRNVYTTGAMEPAGSSPTCDAVPEDRVVPGGPKQGIFMIVLGFMVALDGGG
ncbi:hypothetical protein [Micromonospora sp. Llam0]|uniref:hypothetical protein n=1 Tax=Micromonospora sp. Llam0 TaxID=2485143 RepID=UPI0011CEBBAB|nr:hypothetical protein [Micromonospora sp. Llam0]